MESRQMVREANEQVLVSSDEACMSSGKIIRDVKQNSDTSQASRLKSYQNQNRARDGRHLTKIKGNNKEHEGLWIYNKAMGYNKHHHTS